MQNLELLRVTDLVLMLARRKVKTKIQCYEKHELFQNQRRPREALERHASPTYRATGHAHRILDVLPHPYTQ